MPLTEPARPGNDKLVCQNEWTSPGGTKHHFCILDAGHDGPCGCGVCWETPRGQLHPEAIRRVAAVYRQLPEDGQVDAQPSEHR